MSQETPEILVETPTPEPRAEPTPHAPSFTTGITWEWKSSPQNAGPIAAAKLAPNVGQPGPATAFIFSPTSASGEDTTSVWPSIQTGDDLYIQDSVDGSRWIHAKVAGAATNSSGAFRLPVSNDEQSPDPLSNNKVMLVQCGRTLGSTPVEVLCPVCGRRGRRKRDQKGLPYCGWCASFRADMPTSSVPGP